MILRFIIVILLIILLSLVFKIYKQIKKIRYLILKKTIVCNCTLYIKHKHPKLSDDKKHHMIKETIVELLKENNIRISDSELNMLIESEFYK